MFLEAVHLRKGLHFGLEEQTVRCHGSSVLGLTGLCLHCPKSFSGPPCLRQTANKGDPAFWFRGLVCELSPYLTSEFLFRSATLEGHLLCSSDKLSFKRKHVMNWTP